MFGKPGSKAIGAMVLQTRATPGLGGVSALIWSDGAARDAPDLANSAGRVRGLFIEGKVAGDADISVNGRIRGEVDVTSLTVDEEGLIEGSVTAEHVEVYGRVIGDIHADVIKLHPRACVRGNLTYAKLSIETGAEFEGACRQIPKAHAPAAADLVEEAFEASPPPEGLADEEFTVPPLPDDVEDGAPPELRLHTTAPAERAAQHGESLLN